MTQNRRKKSRFDANLFVEISSTTLKEVLGRGVVIDVSLSGVAIETEVEMDLNREFDLHVEVPLFIRARVVRSLAPGRLKRYGLKFMGQGFLDRLLLKKLLKGSRATKKV